MSSQRRRAFARYQTDRVETASPMQLLVQLYQRAIASLQHAERTPETGRTELVRAQAIVGELRASLRQDVSPELAGNLEDLYLFVAERVGNALADPAHSAGLEAARQVLGTLLEAWREVALQQGAAVRRGAA